MKCLIRKVLALLLLFSAGAVINVAVAWECALFVDLTALVDWHVNSQSANGYEYLNVVIQRQGAAFVWFDSRPKSFNSQSTDSSLKTTNRGFEKTVSQMTRVPFSTTPIPGFARAQHRELLEERWLEARGWPMLSLWCEYEAFGSSLMSARGGLTTNFQPQHRMWADTPHVIPYRVYWPGFALNTIFYAAIAWALFALPFAIRRRRRIKRGLCVRCAYPVGVGNKCTECGAAMEPRRAGGM